jgi:hypothetical protein
MLAVVVGGPPGSGAELQRTVPRTGIGVYMPPAGGAGAPCSQLGRTGDKIGTLAPAAGRDARTAEAREPERMGSGDSRFRPGPGA